ncbi:MAG: hypothetical protein NT066_06240, partial [Candidatus Omnitrophica bacterium]|nr:hypothetical protein [Candidatus Omnitrophota bacterium]
IRTYSFAVFLRIAQESYAAFLCLLHQVNTKVNEAKTEETKTVVVDTDIDFMGMSFNSWAWYIDALIADLKEGKAVPMAVEGGAENITITIQLSKYKVNEEEGHSSSPIQRLSNINNVATLENAYRTIWEATQAMAAQENYVPDPMINSRGYSIGLRLVLPSLLQSRLQRVIEEIIAEGFSPNPADAIHTSLFSITHIFHNKVNDKTYRLDEELVGKVRGAVESIGPFIIDYRGINMGNDAAVFAEGHPRDETIFRLKEQLGKVLPLEDRKVSLVHVSLLRPNIRINRQGFISVFNKIAKRRGLEIGEVKAEGAVLTFTRDQFGLKIENEPINVSFVSSPMSSLIGDYRFRIQRVVEETRSSFESNNGFKRDESAKLNYKPYAVYSAFPVPGGIMKDAQDAIGEKLSSLIPKISWNSPETAHGSIAGLGESEEPFSEEDIEQRKSISDEILSQRLAFPMKWSAKGIGLFKNGTLFLPLFADLQTMQGMDDIYNSHKEAVEREKLDRVPFYYPDYIAHLTIGYIVDNLDAQRCRKLFAELEGFRVMDSVWGEFKVEQAYLYYL